MSKKAPLCPCGLPRGEGKILCVMCWQAAPAEPKSRLRSDDVYERRGAVRRLCEFARKRGKEQLELF